MLNKLVNSLNKTINQEQFSQYQLSSNFSSAHQNSFAFDQWLPTIEIYNFFDEKIIDNLPIHNNYGLSFNKINNANLNFFLISLAKLNFFYRNLIYIKFTDCEFNSESLTILSNNLLFLNNPKGLILDISNLVSYQFVEYLLANLQNLSKKFSLKKSDETNKKINYQNNHQNLTIFVNDNIFNQLNSNFDLVDDFFQPSIRGKIGIDLFSSKINNDNSSLANLQSTNNSPPQNLNNSLAFEKIVNFDNDSLEFYQPLPDNFLQSSALEDFTPAKNIVDNIVDNFYINSSQQKSAHNHLQNNSQQIDEQQILKNSFQDNLKSDLEQSLASLPENFAYQLALQFFAKTPQYRLNLISYQ